MRGYDTLFVHPVNDNYIIKIIGVSTRPPSRHRSG
jgi:hypothetical protein